MCVSLEIRGADQTLWSWSYKVVVKCLRWVLEIKLGHSKMELCAPNH